MPSGESPGGPEVRTQRIHCPGCGFNPQMNTDVSWGTNILQTEQCG